MQFLLEKKLSNKKRLATFIESDQFIYIFLTSYFILNLFFLTDFPYVHSDESWLSGLSRHILERGSISVTEPFFDAYLRYPHAIRILFHMLQAFFILIFGYHIFTFRLISLIFSMACLFIFYKLCLLILESKRLSSLCLLLLSLDIQFIYASHFARQEIIILFFLLLSFYLLLNKIDHHRYRHDLIIGSVIGLSIGFHPNSFIIAFTIGCLYIFYIAKSKLTMKNLLLLILTVSVFALIFIGLSIYMDPLYLTHYMQHGQNFGVGDSVSNKLSDFINFYSHVFNRISIEYYMPNVRFQLMLFPAVFAICLILGFNKSFKDTHLNSLLITIVSINLGLLLIGRFNVTSIVFIFPFMYLLTIYCLARNFGQYKKWLSGFLILITTFLTVIQIKPYDQSYQTYLDQITENIQDSDRVLGNLNSDYAFSDGQLLDVRNLQYLSRQGMSFADYIQTNKIDTILYYEELAFILEHSPDYNVMYGDLTPVFDEMINFLENNCQETAQFISPTYGTELWPFIDQKAWMVHVFKVIAD
ncbi:MAG: hypothetical protein PWR12_240 [Eubacteriaceae bacterium]|nr:hypothetical protein [Eubacteriaceae bacterium]